MNADSKGSGAEDCEASKSLFAELSRKDRGTPFMSRQRRTQLALTSTCRFCDLR